MAPHLLARSIAIQAEKPGTGHTCGTGRPIHTVCRSRRRSGPHLDQASPVPAADSATFSTVAVGSFTAGSATTEASTQPTSRLMRSRWAPVQASRTHDPVTPPQAHRPFSRSRGVHGMPSVAASTIVGSSPLARGSRRPQGQRGGTCRIIPASTGFTGRSSAPRSRGPDHPRSRGVYRARRAAAGLGGGSSPLARGLLRVVLLGGGLRRIIPARAGFTMPRLGMNAKSSDHPRSRGVYVVGVGCLLGVVGSSPLARGLQP